MNDKCHNNIISSIILVLIQIPSLYLAYRLENLEKKVWKMGHSIDDLKEIEEIKIMGENDKTKDSQKKSYF